MAMENEITMEIYHPSKIEFMAGMQRAEPVNKDHTAIIAAKECLRKYFYQIVLGRTPKEDAIYFAWGTAYHKFRQHLELSYRENSNGYGTKFNEAAAMLAYSRGYNAGIAHWEAKGKDQDATSKFSWMTKKRLEASFRKAFEFWKIEKKRGNIEVLAIEQPFNIEMPDGTQRSGTADQIVKFNGKVWGRDFKTTSKDTTFYERSMDPNDQFSGYTYGEGILHGTQIQGQLVELLYNGKSTKNGDKGPEIIPLTTSRTTWQLKDWEKGHMMWVKILDMCREEDNYPMSEKNCSFCQFHAVCTSGSEGAAMAQLKANFNFRPWDHTKVGQD